jgi:hypothetical protein
MTYSPSILLMREIGSGKDCTVKGASYEARRAKREDSAHVWLCLSLSLDYLQYLVIFPEEASHSRFGAQPQPSPLTSTHTSTRMANNVLP